jgi:hypothetical protein
MAAVPAAAAASGGGGMMSMLMGAGGLGGFAAGPIGMVAGAVLQGIAAEQAYKTDKKKSQREARQRMNDQAYNAALADWYKRRDKADWRNASGNYRQFSTVSRINPNYVDNYKPAAVGATPSVKDYVAGDNKNTTAANQRAQDKAAASTLSGYGGGG